MPEQQLKAQDVLAAGVDVVGETMPQAVTRPPGAQELRQSPAHIVGGDGPTEAAGEQRALRPLGQHLRQLGAAHRDLATALALAQDVEPVPVHVIGGQARDLGAPQPTPDREEHHQPLLPRGLLKGPREPAGRGGPGARVGVLEGAQQLGGIVVAVPVQPQPPEEPVHGLMRRPLRFPRPRLP